jgi:hypothetical protein
MAQVGGAGERPDKDLTLLGRFRGEGKDNRRGLLNVCGTPPCTPCSLETTGPAARNYAARLFLAFAS